MSHNVRTFGVLSSHNNGEYIFPVSDWAPALSINLFQIRRCARPYLRLTRSRNLFKVATERLTAEIQQPAQVTKILEVTMQ
jgi:hypothetical protein